MKALLIGSLLALAAVVFAAWNEMFMTPASFWAAAVFYLAAVVACVTAILISGVTLMIRAAR
jgi:hypothetical protein